MLLTMSIKYWKLYDHNSYTQKCTEPQLSLKLRTSFVRHIRHNFLSIIILDYINFIKVIKSEVVAVHTLKGEADWGHRSSHVRKFGTRYR